MSLQKMVKDLVATINEPKGTEPYDTTAEVIRIDGDTAWVHIAGGVDETPAKLTISAEKGDIVQLRVSGGDAFIVGNKTKPPTDDRVANVAQKTAENADLKAILAKKTADDASKVATNYIDFTEEEGLTVGYKDLESKVNISGGGIKLYDETGKVGTQITSTEIDIGTEDTNRIKMGENGIALLSKDGVETFYAGVSPTQEVVRVTERATQNTHTLKGQPISGSTIQITMVTSGGTFSGATFTYGTQAVVSGITYDGDKTFTGLNVSSYYAVYAGYDVSDYPPVLTFGTRQDGHEASGYSATFGKGLISTRQQTVFGQYNVKDTNEYYEMIVGGGGSDAYRRNLMALASESGNLRLNGEVYAGCNSNSTGGRKLVSASTSTGSGTKANMASSTNLSNLAELTLPEEGVYILVGLARFPSNSKGRRGLAWGTSATGHYDHALVVVPPVNGAITRIQSVALCTATSENYKVYLNAYHTAGSGTKLDVDYYWRYIKLA